MPYSPVREPEKYTMLPRINGVVLTANKSILYNKNTKQTDSGSQPRIDQAIQCRPMAIEERASKKKKKQRY